MTNWQLSFSYIYNLIQPIHFSMKSDIFERIENSKPVDFGDVLSKSFELYQKHFTQGLTHSLIVFAVAIPFVLIMYIPIMPVYIEMIQNAGDPYYTPSIFEDYSPLIIVVLVSTNLCGLFCDADSEYVCLWTFYEVFKERGRGK